MRGVQQQWLPALLSKPLRSETAIGDQNTDPQYVEDRVLFAHCGSSQLNAIAPGKKRSQLPAA